MGDLLSLTRNGGHALLERRRIEQAQGDEGAAKHHQRAGEINRTQSPACDQSKRRTGKAQGEIETDRVSAHRETAVLRRRAADRLDAKSGIDQGITKAAQRNAYQSRCGRWR